MAGLADGPDFDEAVAKADGEGRRGGGGGEGERGAFGGALPALEMLAAGDMPEVEVGIAGKGEVGGVG